MTDYEFNKYKSKIDNMIKDMLRYPADRAEDLRDLKITITNNKLTDLLTEKEAMKIIKMIDVAAEEYGISLMK